MTGTEPLWDALVDPTRFRAACAEIVRSGDVARMRALAAGCEITPEGHIKSGAALRGIPAAHRRTVAGRLMRALGALDDVEVLDLFFVPSADLGAIVSGLPALRRLRLSPDDLGDGAFLRTLPALADLEISCCKIRSIAGLAGMTGLTALTLEECTELVDISVLRTLTGLRRLRLIDYEDRIEDPSIVFGLVGLTELCVDLAAVGSWEGLDRLAALEVLEITLPEQPLPRLQLPRLRELRVREGTNADLSVLASLSSLKTLALLDMGALASLAGFPGLVGLTALTLDSVPTTVFRDCPPLLCLETLALRYLEGEVSLGGLEVPRLSRLVLHGCTPADLRAITAWPSLQVLELSGRDRPVAFAPLLQLPHLTVTGNKMIVARWRQHRSAAMLLPQQTAEQRQIYTRIRALLSVDSADHIAQGLELLQTLRDPTVVAGLSAGTTIDVNGGVTVGWPVRGAVPSAFWIPVSLAVLRLTGELQHVRTLRLERTEALRDLSVLRGLPDLERLSLPETPHIRDLSPLASLPRLEDLTMSRLDGVSDYQPLGSIPRLKKLSWRGAVRSLAAVLPKLPALSSFRLEDDGLATLEAFPRVATLRSVWLWCPNLASLSGLERLAPLEELTVGACPLSALGPLASQPSLVSLAVRGTQALSDLRPLRSLSSLRVLTLRGAIRPADLGFLAELTTLAALTLDGRHVTDLAPLRALRRLWLLRLGHLRGGDLSVLADLQQLQDLDLQDATVDVSTMPVLPRLERLNLRGVAAPDLSVVERLPSLQTIQLDHPSITDLSALAGRPELEVHGSDRIMTMWEAAVAR